MFLATKPSRERIQSFLSAQPTSQFSYRHVGASDCSPIPATYNLDHNRVLLGHGEETWNLAIVAIRQWRMFDIPFLQLCWPQAPIAVGTEVAVLVRHFGFYSLNACRIVYLIEEQRHYGFAYGTLTDHSESGEERFSVEWHDDGSVWYDLLAFSRPRVFLARLGYPLARRLQCKFAEDSKRAMLHAVTSSHGATRSPAHPGL